VVKNPSQKKFGNVSKLGKITEQMKTPIKQIRALEQKLDLLVSVAEDCPPNSATRIELMQQADKVREELRKVSH